MHPIGEAARQSGVTIETIRYYERVDLVPPPARSASGRRLYDDAGTARLRFVKRCRDLGFPIPEIRALLALSDDPGETCGNVKTIGEHHLREVRDKIADLTRLEGALAELIAECDRENTRCPALRRLFAG